MAAIRKYLAVAALILYFKAAALAELKYNLLYNVFSQGGTGGKQVYDGSGDQDLTVYEPVLYMDYDVDYNTVLSGSFLLDTFTSASDSIFDAQTGASGGAAPGLRNNRENGDDAPGGAAAAPLKREWESRQDYELSLSRRLGKWLVIPSLGYSQESDYKSSHGGLRFQKSFAEDNFVLEAGILHFNDQSEVFDLSTARFTGWSPKVTDTYLLSATQILGTRDIALAGVSFTNQSGNLSGDRNTVDVNGARAAEILPSGRNRNTCTLRLIHGLNDYLALHFDYRYYTDEWKINAHTFEPSLAIGFGPADAGLIRLLYRWYAQNSALYYKDSFGAKLAYMTSDSDLASFTARETGIQGSYRLDLNGGSGELELGGGIIFYSRSNDLSAVIYQVSIGGSF